MAITAVQHQYVVPGSPGTTATLVVTGAIAAGDLLVLAIGVADGSHTLVISSVTDSAGNTWTHATGGTLGGNNLGDLKQEIYYAKNCLASSAGTNTITVAFNSVSMANIDIRFTEFSGCDTTAPFDVGAGAVGTSTSPSSGAATTTATGDLVYGAGMTDGAMSAAGSGFTLLDITSPNGDISEYKIAGAPGSQTATATSSSAGWVMQMACFKAAAVVATSPNAIFYGMDF